MLSEEKVAPCFVRQTISWRSNESSRKHENIALKSTMTKREFYMVNSTFHMVNFLLFTSVSVKRRLQTGG